MRASVWGRGVGAQDNDLGSTFLSPAASTEDLGRQTAGSRSSLGAPAPAEDGSPAAPAPLSAVPTTAPSPLMGPARPAEEPAEHVHEYTQVASAALQAFPAYTCVPRRA